MTFKFRLFQLSQTNFASYEESTSSPIWGLFFILPSVSHCDAVLRFLSTKVATSCVSITESQTVRCHLTNLLRSERGRFLEHLCLSAWSGFMLDQWDPLLQSVVTSLTDSTSLIDCIALLTLNSIIQHIYVVLVCPSITLIQFVQIA